MTYLGSLGHLAAVVLASLSTVKSPSPTLCPLGSGSLRAAHTEGVGVKSRLLEGCSTKS